MTAPRRPARSPGGGATASLTFHPLTPDRWDDFARLFGARGACGGCWCMYWRRRAADFARGKSDGGAGNRRGMRRLVGAGEVPGLLAYAGDEPIGWVALAPRERYVRLAGSRVLAPVDDRPVWSVVCFFVAKAWRDRGVSVRLLKAAVAHARAQGAPALEGYPYEPATRLPAPFVYTGLVSAFRRAGFVEAARRSSARPVMRCECAGRRRPARGRR